MASETPSIFVLFDCLMGADEKSLLDAPLTARRIALEKFFAPIGHHNSLRLTLYTRDYREAKRWLDHAGGALNGVVAKQAEGSYIPSIRAMLKVKRLRTADCVVGGFRYQSDSRQVGSLLLGLYNEEGKLDHVGFTSAIADKDRKALTKRLEALRGEPGFTREAPGGPSRWSTERSGEWEPLKTTLVVEVRYDHVSGERFRHGTMLVR